MLSCLPSMHVTCIRTNILFGDLLWARRLGTSGDSASIRHCLNDLLWTSFEFTVPQRWQKFRSFGPSEMQKSSGCGWKLSASSLLLKNDQSRRRCFVSPVHARWLRQWCRIRIARYHPPAEQAPRQRVRWMAVCWRCPWMWRSPKHKEL